MPEPPTPAEPFAIRIADCPEVDLILTEITSFAELRRAQEPDNRRPLYPKSGMTPMEEDDGRVWSEIRSHIERAQNPDPTT